jgi:hypothetical protein
MDADRFDALSRALSTAHTRRRLTRLLGGLGLGGVLTTFGSEEAAAALRNGGYPCTTGSQCKTGKCLGSGKCSCSKDFPTCKQPAPIQCKKATCDFSTKRCVTSNKEAGAKCPDDGDPCTKNVCDGSGICIHPKEADGTLCPDGTCQDGDCDPCGRVGYWPNQPCCDSPVKCEAGASCKIGGLATGEDPYCTPCGDVGQQCCSDLSCVAGAICEPATRAAMCTSGAAATRPAHPAPAA